MPFIRGTKSTLQEDGRSWESALAAGQNSACRRRDVSPKIVAYRSVIKIHLCSCTRDCSAGYYFSTYIVAASSVVIYDKSPYEFSNPPSDNRLNNN